ncbi:hydroxyisourate hydrolase [Nocardia arizonensis]|uniref:hydroxyisourate hydrolase n=1 Tax=Nocardia arizonensis TaxID=1141647 RepID=UPI0006D1214A|nr:hydroxyisourate hydrolase [Nocardia arizonensis]
MSSLSTHVLDTVRGAPAVGLEVALYAGGAAVARVRTDHDGRVAALGEGLAAGHYRLVFDTGAYFARLRVDGFYPEVSITFAVTEERHYHVPLLLSPFAFSTYRGS